MRGRPRKEESEKSARVNITIPKDFKEWAVKNNFQFSEELQRIIFERMCEEKRKK